MIILLGGTAETAPMAERLKPLGRKMLALTATQAPLDVGQAHGAQRRSGKLDKEGLLALFRQNKAEAVVDAAHPYAAILHENARKAAMEAGALYMAYVRPSSASDYALLRRVESHEAAAELAFSLGSAALLTTGSRNLAQYVRMAGRLGRRVIARVLDDPESLKACYMEGLSDGQIIAGRGPFTVEQNLEHIKKYGIEVLVTKDSGAAGGVPEKIEAARLAQIPVVMVGRPDNGAEGAFDDMDKLAAELARRLNGKPEVNGNSSGE